VISAGHVPSYLITDKGIQTLSATGPALGFLSDYDYQAAEHRFGPSDTLVVYTDGLTEARNDHDELFGEDRLVKEVGGGGQPADIISRTLGRVMDFCQGQVSDDMAILAVRRQD
jgi:sigma-B regulation protein RsbU (phosphoserine phosphatase)